MAETAPRERDDDWAARHGRLRSRRKRLRIVLTDLEDDWLARHAATKRGF